MKGRRKAREAAFTLARASCDKAAATLRAAFNAYPEARRSVLQLRQAIFECSASGYLPLANFDVRLTAIELLIELMLDHLSRDWQDRTLRHVFFTMTVDAGFSWESAPEVNLSKLQLSARRLLQKLGLQGVGCVDLTPLAKKLPDETNRRLIFHVHGIAWTRDHSFKPRAEGTRLSGSRHYPNMLGAPSVTFVTRKQAAARVKATCEAKAEIRGEPVLEFDDPRFQELDRRDQTPHSIAFMVQYMLAPVLARKSRIESLDGSITAKADTKDMPLKTALRIAEIFSRITPRQAVFGVGVEGSLITREFGKRMDAWERSQRQRGSYVSYQALDLAWRRLLLKQPNLGMEPSVISYRDN